ncbi:MAG: hypothetical protein Q4C96_07225 [Planctomycetia bacterium]|nr:hypothetical protein [Planctomycetia bacterium]
MKWCFKINESFPVWIIIFAVTILLLWLIHTFRQERKHIHFRRACALLLLRSCAFFLLGGMCLQITYVEDHTPPDFVIFLLDDSLSMRLPHDSFFFRPSSSDISSENNSQNFIFSSSRWEEAQKLLTDEKLSLEKRLSSHLDVQQITLSEVLQTNLENLKNTHFPDTKEILAEKCVSPNLPITPLGAALRKILLQNMEPPKAILFLTDGRTSDETEFLFWSEIARKKGIILDFILLGGTTELPQITVNMVPDTSELMTDEPMSLHGKITTNYTENLKTQLQVFPSQDPENTFTQKIIEFPPAIPGNSSFRSQDALLQWNIPEPGEYSFTLQADGIPFPKNNTLSTHQNTSEMESVYRYFFQDSQHFSVSVTDKKCRVFLAWQNPSWEFRYLRNLLAREKSIQLTTWLASAEPGYIAQDASAINHFPTQEEMEKIDIIILGNITPIFLSEKSMLDLRSWLNPKQEISDSSISSDTLQNFVLFWPHFRFSHYTALNASILTAQNTAEEKVFPVSDPHLSRNRALLIIPGPFYPFSLWRGTPLEPCFPFHLDDIHFSENTSPGATFSPTLLGKNLPALRTDSFSQNNAKTWTHFPRIHQYHEISHILPAAMILAELNVPVLSTSHASSSQENTFPPKNSPSEHTSRKIPAVLFFPGPEGNILIHTFDSSWRWRWRNDEQAYRHYWLQTLRWLNRGGAVISDSTDTTTEISSEKITSTTDISENTHLPSPPTSSDSPSSHSKENPFSHNASSKRIPEFQQTTVNLTLPQKIATSTGGSLYGNLPNCRAVNEIPRDLLLSLQSSLTEDLKYERIYEKHYLLWRSPIMLLLFSFIIFLQWALLRI